MTRSMSPTVISGDSVTGTLEDDQVGSEDVSSLKRIRSSQDHDHGQESSFGKEDTPDLFVKDSQQIDVNEEFTQNITRKLKKRRIGVMTQANGTDKYRDVTDDKPARAGIILKLELLNFMCHSAFHLNFGEQTNFIIGRNGSGKSAVLTGISVALGVKASETDRGNSLKGLIMHGKNVARAIVTFKNEGPEAYKPEEYGHKIIIERVLYISKPPSCNIKNEKGKIMSTKKQTIDEILDYFGITIANPMTILTQTEAKTFLAHSTDTGKFKYFMEGTRLQETFNNVKALQSDVKEINQKIRKDSEILTQAKEKLNSALEVWSNFTNSDEFRNQQKLLSGKRLWLEVDSKLQNIEQARTVLKERQQELEKCKLDIDSNSQKKSSNEENLETAKTQVVRLNEEFETINSEKESMKIELTKAQQNVKKVQARIQSLETEVVSDNKSLKETEDKIEIEKDRLQRNTGELFDKYDTAIKKQKEILNKMETDDYKMNEELETLKNKRQTSKQKFMSLNEEIMSNTRVLESDVRNIESKQNSRTDSYGFEVSSLIKWISQNQKQFSGDVTTSPIGMKVSLKVEYDKWGWVLETILQRQLTTFVVENLRDFNILKQKMKSLKQKPDITIRRSEIFDYSSSIPNTRHLSILNTLKFDDKSTECLLVDSNRIHSTLLIEDRQEAENVLLGDHSNKIAAVICFVDGSALRISKRNGTLQTDPIQRRGNNLVPLHRIGDLQIQLQRLKHEIANNNNKLKNVKLEMTLKDDTLNSEIKDLMKNIKSNREKITSIKKSISKLSDKLQELEGGSGKLDSYLEDKKNFETGIQLNLQQIQAYKEEEKKCILEYEDDKMKFSKLSTNLKSLENKINDQKSLIEQYETEIENSEEELRNLQSNAIEFNDDIEALINFTEVSMPPIIETLRDSAIKHCSREEAKIMPGDTIEKIDSEIEIIASRLDQIEKEVGINREEAKIQVIKERTNYNNILLKYDQSVQLHNKIASSLQARLENLTSTASLLIQEVNLVFESALKLRGFTGLIDFNFNLGKLTLKVSTKQTEKLRNVESFSGGEKSFAQIAFLLAIWKPMQSKVRGLDEFDVFMDQVNRRLALKLILQKVSENPKTQTIFITPLEITHIEGLDNDTVNIHEIHPPER